MTDALRPRYHYTAGQGWLNDPNGCVWHDGEYHLFYQHNPAQDGRIGVDMHWGHAVSADLIRWEELPIALYPDPDKGQCWSGTGVVDHANTSGFGSADNPPLVVFYTLKNEKVFTQCCAYSTDRGRTWHEYTGNPVLPQLVKGNRDPKVFRHTESDQWVMVLWVDKGYTFFTSPDLKTWEQQSYLEGWYECPDLFRLTVEGEADSEKWVLVDGSGDYEIGFFDGKTFTTETGRLKGDYGKNFYATQTWNNMPEDKVIQIAWMRGARYPGQVFNQQMTIPCRLTLRRTPAGLRLFRYPVETLENYRGTPETHAEITLSAGGETAIPISGDMADITMNLDCSDDAVIKIVIAGQPLEYKAASGTVSWMESETVLPDKRPELSLRILLDRTSAEVFVNDGALTFSNCPEAVKMGSDLELSAAAGTAGIEKLEIFPIDLEGNPS